MTKSYVSFELKHKKNIDSFVALTIILIDKTHNPKYFTSEVEKTQTFIDHYYFYTKKVTQIT